MPLPMPPTPVVPTIGTYPLVAPTTDSNNPLADRFNQLQSANQQATAGTFQGSNYNYQQALQNRLKSISAVGTSKLNAVQAKQQAIQGRASNNYIPINYTGPGGNALRNKIVQKAESYQGMWYKWGGASPSTSFDCSGLVQYVYGRFGIHLPRISNQQAMVGRRTSIGNLKPGDLVAWDNSSRNRGADHIAIYVGNGMIMEAAHTGSQLRVRRLGANESAWGVSLSQYLG